MAKLDNRTVEEQIIDALNGPDQLRIPRDYLGYSSLGDSCARKLWYGFRWATTESTSGRMERLFGRGHNEEIIIQKELKRIGGDIIDDQKEIIGFERHVKGHIDGIIINTQWFDEDILAEIKTYNDKRFQALVKLKVKQSDYAYYCQMQSYMGKLGLPKALFIATCKNDDHRHVEIVEFDSDTFTMLEAKAEGIVTVDSPPEKIGSGQSTWYECRFCGHKAICHHNASPAKNCRTCQYGTIIPEGQWKCKLDKMILEKPMQLKGCNNWEKLETL